MAVIICLVILFFKAVLVFSACNLIGYTCRLCLGAWSEHGERTGGFYACNRYEVAKQEGVVRLSGLSYNWT